MKALIEKYKARIEEVKQGENKTIIKIAYLTLKSFDRMDVDFYKSENERLVSNGHRLTKEKQTLVDVIKDLEELERNTFTFTGKAAFPFVGDNGISVYANEHELFNNDLKEGKTYEVSVKEITQPKQ